jgi:drug/metabolite transporter (DMT)-like permease
VITRRHAHVRMMPAVALGTVLAALFASTQAHQFAVGASDAGLLFLFGAFNLGLGMSLFVTGVRLLPAAVAALIGVAEPVLGPLWVWLIHGEVPATMTLLGGAVVFGALLLHLGWQKHLQNRAD